MSKSTISTFQLFQAFPDEEAARLKLAAAMQPSALGILNVRRSGYSFAQNTPIPGVSSFRKTRCGYFTRNSISAAMHDQVTTVI